MSCDVVTYGVDFPLKHKSGVRVGSYKYFPTSCQSPLFASRLCRNMTASNKLSTKNKLMALSLKKGSRIGTFIVTHSAQRLGCALRTYGMHVRTVLGPKKVHTIISSSVCCLHVCLCVYARLSLFPILLSLCLPRGLPFISPSLRGSHV